MIIPISKNEFIDAGADAFISKPLFKSKMLHVLQLFCDTCKDTCDGEAVPELHKELAGEKGCCWLRITS